MSLSNGDLLKLWFALQKRGSDLSEGLWRWCLPGPSGAEEVPARRSVCHGGQRELLLELQSDKYSLSCSMQTSNANIGFNTFKIQAKKDSMTAVDT